MNKLKAMKKKKVLLVSIFFLLAILVPLYFAPSPVNADPAWLSGWLYRKSHVINNVTGAGTNYQIKITTYYGSGSDSQGNVYLNSYSRTDFGDVRFTDDDGSTLLDYWMENKVDSNNAVFWVEVADDLNSQNQTIYVYYGKATATTTSNIAATGIFGDDIEDGSVSDWTQGGTGSISASTAQKRSGSYSLMINDTSGTTYCSALTPAFTAQTQKCSLIYYIRVPATTKSHSQDLNGWGLDIFIFSAESNGQWGYYNGAWTYIENYSKDTWYKIELIYDVNADTVLDVLIDAVSKATNKAFRVTVTSITNFIFYGVGAGTKTGVFWVDDVFLRKYVSPEPTHGAWGNEESETPTNDELSLDLTGAVYKGNKTLLTGKQDYKFVHKCSDSTGVTNIAYAEIRLDYATKNVILRATRGSGDSWTFSEQSDPSNYVTLNVAGSSHSTSGNQKTFNYLVTINWNWDDASETLGVRAYVIDAESGSDQDDYTNIFGVENDLEASSLAVDDYRCNPSQTLTFSGYWYYEGTSIYPPDGNYNVEVKLKSVNPSTVGTSTSGYATQYSCHRKSFYANGLFWVFYSDGTNMVYRTSTDSITWTGATTVRSATHGYKFSIWFDDTYLHYAYANGDSIYYRRGTPNANGTVTWSADEQTVSTTYNLVFYPFMFSVDSNGYVWIGYRDMTPSEYYPYVIKSGNNNGTWGTTPIGFPYQLSTTSSINWRGSVVPLTSGKMLVLYARDGATIKAQCWNGSAWGTEVATTSAIYIGYYHSAIAQGDDVHLTFLQHLVYNIVYTKYSYATNSFGAETTLYASAIEPFFPTPVISIDGGTNNLYVFWTGYPTANHIYYRKYVASTSTWEIAVDWITETATLYDRITCFYKDYGNKIGLLYMNKTVGPYQVRFAYISMAKATDTTLVNGAFSVAFATETTVASYNYTVEATYMVSTGSFPTVTVESLTVYNIQTVEYLGNGQYKYKAQIKYASDNTPINGAYVNLTLPSGTNIGQATSNSTGWITFILSQINATESGNYTIYGVNDNNYDITHAGANQTLTIRSWTLNSKDVDGNALSDTTINIKKASTSVWSGNDTTLKIPQDTFNVTVTWLQNIQVNATTNISITGDTTTNFTCLCYPYTVSGTRFWVASNATITSATWTSNIMTITFSAPNNTYILVASSTTKPTYILNCKYDYDTDFSTYLILTHYANTTIQISHENWADTYIQRCDHRLTSLSWTAQKLRIYINGTSSETGTLKIYCGSRESPTLTFGFTTESYSNYIFTGTYTFTSQVYCWLDWIPSPGGEETGGGGPGEISRLIVVFPVQTIPPIITGKSRQVNITFTFDRSTLIFIENIAFPEQYAGWFTIKGDFPIRIVKAEEGEKIVIIQLIVHIPDGVKADQYRIPCTLIIVDGLTTHTINGYIELTVAAPVGIPDIMAYIFFAVIGLFLTATALRIKKRGKVY